MTSSDNTTESDRSASKTINIFSILYLIHLSPMLSSNYSPTTLPLTQQQQKAFRLQLVEQLVANYCSRKKPGLPRSSTTLPHPPPALPPADDCGPLPVQATRTALHLPSHQKKRCVYCQKYRSPRQSHEVVWFCKECPGQPALCLTGREDGSDCFRIWHAHLQ